MKFRGRRLIATAGLFMTSATMILLFQNCDAQKLFVGSSAQEEKSGGGGTGYDGKPYVEIVSGQICPDGKSHAEIRLRSALDAALVRENCKDIPPLVLSPQSYVIDPKFPDVLNYSGRRFVATGSSCAQSGSQAFTVSGTFIVPKCVSKLTVTLIGGAGGYTTTAACPSPNWALGGDGGAGVAVISGVTPDLPIPILVGSGGGFLPCVNVGSCSANGGGTTSFGNYVDAIGGYGGSAFVPVCQHINGTQGYVIARTLAAQTTVTNDQTMISTLGRGVGTSTPGADVDLPSPDGYLKVQW